MSHLYLYMCMVVFLLILIVYRKANAIHSIYAIMIPQLLMNRDRELNTFLTLPRLREG